MARRKVLFIHYSGKSQELLDCNIHKEVPRPLSGWYYDNNNLFQYSHMGRIVKRAKCPANTEMAPRTKESMKSCLLRLVCLRYVFALRRICGYFKKRRLEGFQPWQVKLLACTHMAVSLIPAISPFSSLSPSSSSKKVSPSFEPVLSSLHSILTCCLM